MGRQRRWLIGWRVFNAISSQLVRGFPKSTGFFVKRGDTCFIMVPGNMTSLLVFSCVSGHGACPDLEGLPERS